MLSLEDLQMKKHCTSMQKNEMNDIYCQQKSDLALYPAVGSSGK